MEMQWWLVLILSRRSGSVASFPAVMTAMLAPPLIDICMYLRRYHRHEICLLSVLMNHCLVTGLLRLRYGGSVAI